MKICFVSRLDPNNRKSFSGTFYGMFSHLKKYHDVDYVGAVQFNRKDKLLIDIKKWHTRLIKRKKYNLHNEFYCKLLAKYINAKLEGRNYDVLFAPAASECIAYLETKTPIVYLSDTTFENLVDYYPRFTGLDKNIIAEGNIIEKHAIDKGYKAIFSSTWGANSAINFYKAPASKVHVVDFGANLLYAPTREEALSKIKGSVCNLLFIGVDWLRKGGELSYRIFLHLRNKGFNCRLTIIGCNPKLTEGLDAVTIVPFLDKNNEADFKIIYDYFKEAHFLLLPTRADCTPIVFSEAAAFGIPVITTNTGGIPSVIHEGKNGFMFSLDAKEEVYAPKIIDLFNDDEQYKALCKSCRTEYETRLNWDTWAKRISSVIQL